MSNTSGSDSSLRNRKNGLNVSVASTDSSAELYSSSSIGDQTPMLPRALGICCPHCHKRTPLADDAAITDIRCSLCGNQVSLVAVESPEAVQSAGAVSTPKTIGHFQLMELLGTGGFGIVWKARDTQLDRIVAVKCPHKGKLNLNETEQFLREARAAAQLRHPNIVSVHEVGVEAGSIYIVSDFIEGLTLDKWFSDQRLTCREAASLAVKIADALHHAHEHGVIHRDLKPSNIMIDPAGEPHIMDFGLAKRSAGEITMTMEGQVLGTPAYMSPEQAKGYAHEADRRTDVYSLGVILFELLTGERPFRGNLQMLLKQVIEDDSPSPRKLNGQVSRDLETICLKCLQKDLGRRYNSAKALSEELGRYLSGMPIQARPVGRIERMERWCSRNPLVAGFATAAIVCLLFGLIAASIGYVRASRAQARAEASLLQARQAVDDLFTTVSEDTLLNQPGMQPLRSDLLRRARNYYEKFLVQSGEDETVRDELALAHFRVGLITEEIESPVKAMPSYEIARTMQKQLLEKDPQDIKRLKALGDTLNALGRSLLTQQHVDSALEAYAEAIDVRSRLVSQTPDSKEFKRILANSWMNTGLAENERNPSRARECMEKAQAIRQELLTAEKNDLEVRRDLAMGYFNLGKLGLTVGDGELAETSLENACQLSKQLSQSNPAYFELSYLAAVSCRLQADLKCANQQISDAIRLYAEAIAILEPLAKKNPSVNDYQIALAEIHINLGQAEFEQGDREAALTSFEQAVAILEPLATVQTEIGRYRRDYIVSLHAVGKLHHDQSRRQKSIIALEKLRQILEQTDSEQSDAEGLSQQIEMIKSAVLELRSIETKDNPTVPTPPHPTGKATESPESLNSASFVCRCPKRGVVSLWHQ